jgi:hypothetical protein
MKRINYLRGALALIGKYRRRGEWNAVWAETYYALRFLVTGKYSWEPE